MNNTFSLQGDIEKERRLKREKNENNVKSEVLEFEIENGNFYCLTLFFPFFFFFRSFIHFGFRSFAVAIGIWLSLSQQELFQLERARKRTLTDTHLRNFLRFFFVGVCFQVIHFWWFDFSRGKYAHTNPPEIPATARQAAISKQMEKRRVQCQRWAGVDIKMRRIKQTRATINSRWFSKWANSQLLNGICYNHFSFCLPLITLRACPDRSSERSVFVISTYSSSSSSVSLSVRSSSAEKFSCRIQMRDHIVRRYSQIISSPFHSPLFMIFQSMTLIFLPCSLSRHIITVLRATIADNTYGYVLLCILSFRSVLVSPSLLHCHWICVHCTRSEHKAPSTKHTMPVAVHVCRAKKSQRNRKIWEMET